MRIAVFILFLLVQGCSSFENTACSTTSPLTTEESDKLHIIVMNNQFLSGCVTESISVLKEHSTTKYANKCKLAFDNTLNYFQWMEIYNSCMVK